jgi:hypothetical protein
MIILTSQLIKNSLMGVKQAARDLLAFLNKNQTISPCKKGLQALSGLPSIQPGWITLDESKGNLID